MTDFYDDLADTALELIAEFGRTVSYRPDGTVDRVPGEPWRGQDPLPAVSVTMAVISATAIDRQNNPAVVFDKRALVASKDLTFTPGVDDLVDDGETLRVAWVNDIKPGDTSVYRELLLTTASV